jgi:hypothetical protein
MGFHLSPDSYDRKWTCSECGKPIAAIPGKFKIYNRRQLTCGPECALARKTRRQVDRRAKRKAAIYGGRPANFMPNASASESARRREIYRRTGEV